VTVTYSREHVTMATRTKLDVLPRRVRTVVTRSSDRGRQPDIRTVAPGPVLAVPVPEWEGGTGRGNFTDVI